MATPNLVLELNEKDEIVRIARGRQSVIARLDTATKTLVWKDDDTQGAFHKSVDAFLEAEKIHVDTILMEGQKPDVLPKNSPPAPPMHKMQGDLTPAFLEWEMKWKPISFQNRMGVKLRKLKEGEPAPKDPSDLWVRAKVIRTDSRPKEGTHGGEYISTRFTMDNQIVARRRSHVTFEPKEIYRGESEMDQAEPYQDPHSEKELERMEKRGDIEVVWRRHAPASAGSAF